MLELADKYEISLTFSTVGFLFAETKQELLQYLPLNKPTYNNINLSPYPLLDSIGVSENVDPFHYAKSIIMEITKLDLLLFPTIIVMKRVKLLNSLKMI